MNPKRPRRIERASPGFRPAFERPRSPHGRGEIWGTATVAWREPEWACPWSGSGRKNSRCPLNARKGASLETWTYGYDAKNELTWVEKRATDGGTLQQRVEFRYDPFGNRLEKKVDADGNGTFDTIQRYAYDGWKIGPQRSS